VFTLCQFVLGCGSRSFQPWAVVVAETMRPWLGLQAGCVMVWVSMYSGDMFLSVNMCLSWSAVLLTLFQTRQGEVAEFRGQYRDLDTSAHTSATRTPPARDTVVSPPMLTCTSVTSGWSSSLHHTRETTPPLQRCRSATAWSEQPTAAAWVVFMPCSHACSHAMLSLL
jgi:NADH:ubiquinone oxidoreductase subunit